jgi:restriction endonuclease
MLPIIAGPISMSPRGVNNVLISSSSTDWAENVFKEAVAEFIASLPKKSSKLESFLDLKPSRLEDIVKCVSTAQLQYQDRRGDSKIRRCLTSFAQKVHCYGTVMDALVQQTPEYVSLVYGAMKLVLVVCETLKRCWTLSNDLV